MSRLSTDAHTECEDRARILKQNSQLRRAKLFVCKKTNSKRDNVNNGILLIGEQLNCWNFQQFNYFPIKRIPLFIYHISFAIIFLLLVFFPQTEISQSKTKVWGWGGGGERFSYGFAFLKKLNRPMVVTFCGAFMCTAPKPTVQAASSPKHTCYN